MGPIYSRLFTPCLPIITEKEYLQDSLSAFQKDYREKRALLNFVGIILKTPKSLNPPFINQHLKMILNKQS